MSVKLIRNVVISDLLFDKTNVLQPFPDLCSHQRSVYFYAESVKSPDTPFLAISARSWRYFKANDVNYTNVASMGIDCTKDAFGSYYLQTNGEAPYSRDISGIRFVN